MLNLTGAPRLTLHLPRYGLVVAMLLVAILASYLMGWRQTPPPLQARGANAPGGRVYFADVEGWYRITSYEAAVVSPYDLSLSALPASLPMRLGPWEGSDRPVGPEIVEWFDAPVVALQRAYADAQGRLAWLAIFGHRGPSSFRLFEHTPASCYPLSGWSLTDQALETIQLGAGTLYAQRSYARSGDDELVVLYWYLWDNPRRDPRDGVLSIRVSAPVKGSREETLRMLKEDFIPRLFTDVVPWHRF